MVMMILKSLVGSGIAAPMAFLGVALPGKATVPGTVLTLGMISGLPHWGAAVPGMVKLFCF
jgi:hypothetical protein